MSLKWCIIKKWRRRKAGVSNNQMIFDHAVENCSLCLETSCTADLRSEKTVLKSTPHSHTFQEYFPMTEQPNFYVVFTSPVKFTKDYNHACIIADEYYNETGYVVAVEQAQGGHYA